MVADAAIWVVVLLAVLLLLHRALRQIVLRRSVTPPRNVITVCCPGGGVFFWWQIGAMRELLALYELPPERVVLSGASAGALAAVLAQCDVDTDAAHESANRLAEEAGCFSNPLGLCGVWGRLVYAWLDALLPEDAAAHCTGRCRVVVTFTPTLTPTPTLALALTLALTLTLILTLTRSHVASRCRKRWASPPSGGGRSSSRR